MLAITTSASMTRARQHGDDGAATTRRAGCGHDNAGRRRGDGYPQLSSLRSSLRSSFDPHSDPHSDPPSTLTPLTPLTPHFDPHSHPPHSDPSPIAGWAFLWGDGKRPGIGADAMHAKVLRVLSPRPRQRMRRAGRQSDSDSVATSRDRGCHQCREWRGEQGCGLGMVDMTGELIMVLPKDCFAGCSDDDATSTQRRLARCPHRLPLRIEAGWDDATTR